MKKDSVYHSSKFVTKGASGFQMGDISMSPCVGVLQFVSVALSMTWTYDPEIHFHTTTGDGRKIPFEKAQVERDAFEPRLKTELDAGGGVADRENLPSGNLK